MLYIQQPFFQFIRISNGAAQKNAACATVLSKQMRQEPSRATFGNRKRQILFFQKVHCSHFKRYILANDNIFRNPGDNFRYMLLDLRG